MRAFAFWATFSLALAAFVATVVLAFVGAVTDDIHVWQVFFVSLMLSALSGAACAGTAATT